MTKKRLLNKIKCREKIKVLDSKTNNFIGIYQIQQFIKFVINVQPKSMKLLLLLTLLQG